MSKHDDDDDYKKVLLLATVIKMLCEERNLDKDFMIKQIGYVINLPPLDLPHIHTLGEAADV